MSARDVAERLRGRKVIAAVQTKEGPIYVRGLNGRERVKYFEWLQQDSTSVLLSDHRVLGLTLCEEDGSPVFSDEESALQVLQEWAHEDVTAAAKKALALSGIGKDATEDAGKKS